MSIRTFGAILAIAASSVPAQGTNCVLLGTHNQHGPYNDVWGYRAPNGKEYCLLGATTGTVVIDCTNPASPVERGWFPWASSTWRDIRTYQSYAYVVTESGSGFMIIDLTNPDSPVSLGVFGSQYFTNCHNVCIDTGTGKLYCAGTNTGTPVFDLAANPTNPPYVGHLTSSGNSNYFHDLCVENGYVYGSMIYNGNLRIYDASSWPHVSLSNSPTPSSFTHNAWPNAAGTVCVTTDERAGGVVQFFDITNKSNPVPLGQFTPNSTSIPHNAYITGNLCHVSWYTEGYRCIDISDPSNPVEVASYDTWPGASGGFNGAWGVYPFQPSGNIYVNDISTGLYIVRLNLPTIQLAHTPLAGTEDEDGPYVVDATIASTQGLSSAVLSWSVNGGASTQVPMTPLGNDLYRASIPGQYAPSTVAYRITANDSNGSRSSPPVGDHEFGVGTVVQVFADDLETDLGWTHGMVGGQDDWQRGTPAGRSGTSGGVGWSDPGAAFSGSNVWGNDLGGSGWNGSYANNVNNWLQSPAIPTNGAQGIRLRFQRWLSVQNGDSARLLVNGILVWQNGGALRDTAWTQVDYDVGAITNTAGTVTIRFELQTNGSNVSGGWNLDDVELFALSDRVPARHYGAGTPGTGSIVPQIALSAPPSLGTTFQIQAGALLGGAPLFLGISTGPAAVPTFGITALIDSTNAAFLFGLASGTPGLPGIGAAAWNQAVPNTPALDNLDLFGQVLALDMGSPGGLLSCSDGIRIRVCH